MKGLLVAIGALIGVAMVVIGFTNFAGLGGDLPPAPTQTPQDYRPRWEQWCATEGGVIVAGSPSDSCQINGEAISYWGAWPSGWHPPGWPPPDPSAS